MEWETGLTKKIEHSKVWPWKTRINKKAMLNWTDHKKLDQKSNEFEVGFFYFIKDISFLEKA